MGGSVPPPPPTTSCEIGPTRIHLIDTDVLVLGIAVRPLTSLEIVSTVIEKVLFDFPCTLCGDGDGVLVGQYTGQTDGVHVNDEIHSSNTLFLSSGLDGFQGYTQTTPTDDGSGTKYLIYHHNDVCMT